MMTKRIVALVAVLTLVMTMFILPTTAGAIYEAYSCCSNDHSSGGSMVSPALLASLKADVMASD